MGAAVQAQEIEKVDKFPSGYINGIIVRNRNRVQLCQNCLRITIGTKTENSELIAALRQY